MINHTRASIFVFACLLVAGSAVRAAPVDVTPDPWPRDVAAFPEGEGTEKFVTRLLSRMTLEEKVGQMIQADIASITPKDLAQFRLGSILAGGNAAPAGNVRTDAKAWLELTDEFYRASLASTSNHQPIPIIFGIDAVHGNAKIVGATIFPHNVGLGAAHDPFLIQQIGAATADEVATLGIDWTFAPTVAVVRDVRWGRSYESYSETPSLVAEYAPAMLTGLQGAYKSVGFLGSHRTLGSVKHFLGDGGTVDGRDQGDTQVSESDLAQIHGAGYTAALKAGALIVMASYNSWNGVKMHASHHLLTEVLKDRMGFRGFVVGDWNAHEQIPGCTKSDCAAAIIAGVDMLMAPDEWRSLYRNTIAEVRDGTIPQARVDDAVRRILRVKTIAGVFTRKAPSERAGTGDFASLGSAPHRALARAAVRESLVLLKNSDHLLPLDPHAQVLVTGRGANDIGMQTGGWTIDWQGNHNTAADFPGATSIYAGIQAALGPGGRAELSGDGSFKQRPDVAIIVYGEGPYAEFNGDRETLDSLEESSQELRILQHLNSLGIPTVSVFLSGRPLWVNPEINSSDAFIAAWLPGSEGEGIGDLLFKSLDGATPYHFTGRLAFSWPSTAMPVTFVGRDVVQHALFHPGYGLDYGSASNVGQLSEDPKIPSRFAALDGSLYAAGHPTAPWSTFVADRDAEVHVTTHEQASPHAAVQMVTTPDGARLTWQGSTLGTFRLSGRPQDLRLAASNGMTLTMRYRVDAAPPGSIRLGAQCTVTLCETKDDAMIDVTREIHGAKIGGWSTLAVPLRCFAGDLGRVDAPFAITTAAPYSITISEVRLISGGVPGGSCPASSMR